MRKTKLRLLTGKKSKRTYWGLIGCSHGDRFGGYDNYRYGIKGFFSIGYYVGWGIYKEATNAFN